MTRSWWKAIEEKNEEKKYSGVKETRGNFEGENYLLDEKENSKDIKEIKG